MVESPREMIPLNVTANVQSMGDVFSNAPADLVGSPGMRVEGFSLSSTVQGKHALCRIEEKYINGRREDGQTFTFYSHNTDVDVYYQGYVQDKGDTVWRKNGEYMGTRGQQRKLEVL